MKVSEYDIESKVVKYARDKGVLVVKQTHVGARSHPDRAFYFEGGRLLQIEFKAPGARPTVLQAVTIKKLIGLGFAVAIVDDVRHGKDLVDSFFHYLSTELSDDDHFETLKICDKVLARKAR